MHTTDVPPISENLVPGSGKLYFFFGGIIGAIGMPPFEFYQSAQILNCSRIFLRDPYQSWYQRGLPTVGNDAFAIGNYLKAMIMESGASQIYFVGNSMGGFAALLFCSMLRCGRAIAFAPQTFVSQDKRLDFGDLRWAPKIESMHKNCTASHIYDLKIWIQDQFPELRASVYVSTADILDMRHAKQLEGFANIDINHYPDAGHTLVRWLRDEGMLSQILKG